MEEKKPQLKLQLGYKEFSNKYKNHLGIAAVIATAVAIVVIAALLLSSKSGSHGTRLHVSIHRYFIFWFEIINHRVQCVLLGKVFSTFFSLFS